MVSEITPTCDLIFGFLRCATIGEEECTLLNITKSNKDNKWQPRKVSVDSVPQPSTWLKAMNIKINAAIKYRDEHIEVAHAAKAAGVPFTPEKDYCAVCTSVGRKCPSEVPGV